MEEKRLQVEADRVKQASDLQREHEAFAQKFETEKAAQAQDFANRQQEIDRVHREKEAQHVIELEEARLHGTESHKGASLGGGGQRTTSVKLPKLDFPKFFGDVTKWKEFGIATPRQSILTTDCRLSINLTILDRRLTVYLSE